MRIGMRKGWLLVLLVVFWSAAVLAQDYEKHWHQKWHQRWHGQQEVEQQGTAKEKGMMEHKRGSWKDKGMMNKHMMGCPMMMPSSPKGISPKTLRERAQMMREMAQEMETMAQKMEKGEVSQEEWDAFRAKIRKKCPMHHEMMTPHRSN